MAPTIGKSYMSRSEHSLVTDLREDHRHHHQGGHHHRGRRRSGFQQQHSITTSAGGLEVGGDYSEAGSEYSELSEDEDSEEEAELTRLKRFCWAICCCCRCYSCCQESDEVVVVTAAIATDESTTSMTSNTGEVNKGRGCDCSLVTAWEKAVGFRNCIRDRLEFAEYGKVCYLYPLNTYMYSSEDSIDRFKK